MVRRRFGRREESLLDEEEREVLVRLSSASSGEGLKFQIVIRDQNLILSRGNLRGYGDGFLSVTTSHCQSGKGLLISLSLRIPHQ